MSCTGVCDLTAIAMAGQECERGGDEGQRRESERTIGRCRAGQARVSISSDRWLQGQFRMRAVIKNIREGMIIYHETRYKKRNENRRRKRRTI